MDNDLPEVMEFKEYEPVELFDADQEELSEGALEDKYLAD